MNPATDSMSDFSVTACGRMTTADAEADEIEVAEPALEVDAVRALPLPPPPPPPPIGESVADIMAPSEPVAVIGARYVLRRSDFKSNAHFLIIISRKVLAVYEALGLQDTY